MKRKMNRLSIARSLFSGPFRLQTCHETHEDLVAVPDNEVDSPFRCFIVKMW